MKKLIALIAIIVICASGMFAEKITNPFKFSVSAKFTAKADNAYTGATLSATETAQDTWDNRKVGSNYLEFTPEASMSGTFAKIYALSFKFGGRLRQYDTRGAKDEVRFMFTWGNKVTAVKDYLDVNVDLGYNIMNNGGDSKASLWYEPGYEDLFRAAYLKSMQMTSLIPTATFGLGGKVGKTGFKWSVSQDLILQLISNFYKDNNPSASGKTDAGTEWYPYTCTNGTAGVSANTAAITKDVQINNYGHIIDSLSLVSKINLEFEFFHFFAPENVTCAIKWSNTLGYNMPYSHYIEFSKEFTYDTTAGLDFNIAGIKFFVGARSRNYAYYNTSAPLDGSLGSDWSHDGKAWLAATTTSDVTSAHHNTWWRGGPQIKFELGKEWLTFTADWQGYAFGGAATYDNDSPDGGHNVGGSHGSGWKNEFNIGCNIKL